MWSSTSYCITCIHTFSSSLLCNCTHTVVQGSTVHVLDLAARVDSTAEFMCKTDWGDLTFPPPFGRNKIPEVYTATNLTCTSQQTLSLLFSLSLSHFLFLTFSLFLLSLSSLSPLSLSLLTLSFSPPPQEAYIAELDAKSGASLKLTVLNQHGRIWTMVAGGGASVIYR